MVLHLPLHVTWKWKAALFQSRKETPDYSLFFLVQKVLQVGLPDSAWGLEQEKVKDSSSLRAGKFFGRISGAPWEMCSANNFFWEWVTDLASNYQIRPHKSEQVVHGQALRSALFQAVSAGSRNAFSPGLNGHLCCYPWCSPFGKGIKKPFKALASELRMRQDWGAEMGEQPTSGKAALCTEWALPVFLSKNPMAHGDDSTFQSLGQHEIWSEHTDISSEPLVLTNIHTNCYSLSYSMHTCCSKDRFHLPPPNLKL